MTEPPSPLTMLFSRHTRRREFITLLGGAAAAWPFAARAQEKSGRKRPLIGFLGGASFESARPTVGAWLEGMRELGYVAGQSIDIEYRFAEGDYHRLLELARELAQLKPDRRDLGQIFRNVPICEAPLSTPPR